MRHILITGGAGFLGSHLCEAVLARGLTVNFFYSWLDGEYQSYIDNGVELAAVRYMQNAPKYQLGVGLELAMPHLRFGDLVLNDRAAPGE